MPLPHKKPDWAKRAGRRQLTKQEAAKVEVQRVDTEIAKKRTQMQKARAETLKKKLKPKPKLWYKRYNPFAKLAEGPLAPPKKKKD